MQLKADFGVKLPHSEVLIDILFTIFFFLHTILNTILHTIYYNNSILTQADIACKSCRFYLCVHLGKSQLASETRWICVATNTQIKSTFRSDRRTRNLKLCVCRS